MTGAIKRRTLYRVFFNRRGAPKNEVWSIDTGEGTERRHFRSVVLKTTALGQYNGKDPDWQNPIAWFYVRGRLNIRGADATITSGRARNGSNGHTTIRRGVPPRTRRLRA